MKTPSFLNSQDKNYFLRMNGKSCHAVYSKNLDENAGKTKRQAADAKPSFS